jgi:small conductance mechanosensitive channel
MTWTDIAWNVAYALLILLAGNFLAGWARGMVASSLAKTRLDPIVRQLVVSIVRPAVLLIAAFAALQQLGIPITTFAAIAGAVTLAVGMSLQGSLSNVASGTLLLTFRPFNVGDTVTTGAITGKVKALHLFTTVLDTFDGQTVTLPNDVVWKAPITNFSDRPTRRIRLVFTLPPDADLAKAEEALTAAMAGEERLLEEPAPSVAFDPSTDLGVPVALVCHVTNPDFGSVRSALQRSATDLLQAAGLTQSVRAQ